MTTATKETKAYHSKIDLSEDLRKKVVAKLQITLAATADLTSQAETGTLEREGKPVLSTAFAF